MEQMAYSKKEVLKIFGITNNTLDSWEQLGYIHRLPVPTPRYSRISIEKLLYDGTDNILMKKDREITQLKLDLLNLRNTIDQLKIILNDI